MSFTNGNLLIWRGGGATNALREFDTTPTQIAQYTVGSYSSVITRQYNGGILVGTGTQISSRLSDGSVVTTGNG